MIRLRSRLVCISEGEAHAVRAHLPDHICIARAEPGCLTFGISPNYDPMLREVLESFRDRASFAAHQARTRDSA